MTVDVDKLRERLELAGEPPTAEQFSDMLDEIEALRGHLYKIVNMIERHKLARGGIVDDAKEMLPSYKDFEERGVGDEAEMHTRFT